MFRITRGINLQHAPAFSPIFRFPDGATLPLYTGGEPDDAPPAAAASTVASADASATADESVASAEAAPDTPA
jgi:hypothetical protein